MPSFGEKLRLEREKRNITLEQISSSTKIGTRMLQALEEERFSQLPGGIFNKGFVRAYARTVGLDEDQAVADYLQASGEAQSAGPDSATGAAREAREAEENRLSRLEAISDSPSRPLPWGVFAVILLAIALSLSLWSRRHREPDHPAIHTPVSNRAPQSTPPPSDQTNSVPSASAQGSATTQSPDKPSPELQPSSTSASQVSSSSSPSASVNQPHATEPTHLPLAQTPSTSTQTTSAQNTSALTHTPQPAPEIPAASSAGEFTVVIHARDQSWVSISIDGKFVGSETLAPGSNRTFRARKDVFVKAGNAAALDFQLDGKPLDVSASPGEVKSVTIGPAGLLPNLPAAPSQP